ncbi:MAG: hypothetical protein WD342_09495 [Verrucomicrobiales bacterium]
MTLTNSELTFVATPATVVFGVVLVIATAVVGFVIWRRNRFSAASGWLEALRLLIVVLVALTLNQPEWRETFEPEEKPVIAVLRDASGSMATEDVLEPDTPAANARSREEVASDVAASESWASLEPDYDVVVQDFSPETDDAGAGTDIAAALSASLEQHPNLRGIVLVSDGDWNEGESPARAATRLRMKDVPVFAVPIGSETRLPDLAVTAFDVPTFGIAGKPVRLPFTLASSLPRRHSTTMEIATSEGETLATDVTLPAMGRLQDAVSWTPQATGDFELTLTLPAVDEERDRSNNTLTAPITIRREELKILLIDTFPRWEYRYLRNALERDPGVEVSCLLFHPDIESVGGGPGYLEAFPDPDLLASFDVVFLGDVGVAPDQLSRENVESLKQQVATQAAGLVLMPGFRGHQQSLLDTEIEDLFPVTLDPAQPRGWGSSTPGQFELTELGARSLLTRLEDSDDANADVWGSLPGFQWYAGVTRAKAGSEVLATHSSESNRHGRIPLIVTKTYGTGKILFMGTDGAWRWRKGVEDKYHYRFWGQVARWMAYQRNMASGELMRLFYSPDRPRTGDTLTLNANAMSPGGEPLQSATIVVQITAPSGKVDSIRLQPGGEEQWGLFTGNFEPTEPGEHEITMTGAENGGRLETTIAVQGSAREKTNQPARHDVLDEIARITRGELFAAPDLETIRARITALPEPDLLERRLRLWASPIWIGAIVLLLTVFWIGRKAVGAV